MATVVCLEAAGDGVWSGTPITKTPSPAASGQTITFRLRLIENQTVSNEDFIAALEENHRFPGPYTLKVIGANSEDFRVAVFAVVREEMRLQYEPRHEIKQTPSGRHQSLTLHLTAKDAHQVASVYARLQTLEEVAMLM